MIYPDNERIDFLKSRPWYSNIHERLNSILQTFEPNTQIVAMPREHIDLEQLITSGTLMTNHVIDNIMMANQCHDNCEWLKNLNVIQCVCTGYALSDDGLWRFHSWGINFNDEIVETTEPRIKYYGIIV